MNADTRFQLNVFRKLDNLEERLSKKFEDIDKEFVYIKQEIQDMKAIRSTSVSFPLNVSSNYQMQDYITWFHLVTKVHSIFSIQISFELAKSEEMWSKI